MSALKPPFAYYGGKMSLAAEIAAVLPEHDHYVEPFAGSLAVLLAKKPSRAETVNDLDGDLVNFWRTLRDRPEDLAHLALLTPHSRDEYESCKAERADDDLERARRVWVLLTQGRSHSMKPTGWKNAVKATARQPLTDTLVTFASRIMPAAERLKYVTIENRDAVEMVREYGRDEGVCIYADPPYVGSTRSSGNYRLEMLADDLHSNLARALLSCRSTVVLSGYASSLYDELFAGWHRLEFPVTRGLHGQAKAPEVLWSNRHLGRDDLFGGAA